MQLMFHKAWEWESCSLALVLIGQEYSLWVGPTCPMDLGEANRT